MEGKVGRPRGRPRKRTRPEDTNGVSSNRGKRLALEIKPSVPRSLLYRYVLKDFDESRVSLGKVVSYSAGLYRVEYEDGCVEDLKSCYLRRLIIEDSYFDDELRCRRDKLDEDILKEDERRLEVKNQVNGAEVSTCSTSSGSVAEEGGGEDRRDPDLETMSPLVPVSPVDLPCSSGTIGVPEEGVMHLLSVYGFLRSFSVQLYIYPFGLDEFVGALNFLGPSSLLDAVHVALMKALKGRLERLASEESVVASNCLRCIDWSLLDALTWPVYLVQYFSAMGHARGPQWSVFYEFAVKKEYYSLPVVMKLKILQILCDNVFDVAAVRAEIDTREESEVGYDPDGVTADLPENGPRRVHPRFAKTSACKEKELNGFVPVNHGISSMAESKSLSSRCTDGAPNGVSSDVDGNSDECRLCGMDGTLLCCDGCPLAYHSRCIGVLKMYIPDGPWYCPECTINKMGPTIAHKTSLRGAVCFGVDPHGRFFLGTCNHLLVLQIYADPDIKYYSVTDIPKVVTVLLSATNHRLEYLYICKEISQYWDLPGGVVAHLRAVETDLVSHIEKEGDEEVSDLSKPENASSSSRNNIQCASASGYVSLGRSSGTHGKNLLAGSTHKGLTFKPHAYINHYTNGELAASAATTLAVLMSEETHEPDQHKFSNAKKAASSNILLQVKAFSLVASTFFWPSPEKKEITRERCGWCHSCKLTSASRRGCMLNAAVTGATKSAVKIFTGLFPLKNGDGVLSSIAAYILYLEESLRGLIVGPFLCENLRKQWRKNIEATTCKTMKVLLLELEENICSIALSSDWLKLMDDWLIEHSIFQSVRVTVGTTQKRGPGKKRQKNQAEVTAEVSNDDSFTWWRGGKVSKVILLKAVLLKPTIKKAAWQGGVKKFPEFNYGDGSHIPKRSRRSIWRAAVENCKNISQLALQVRYLDMNIRWSELVRPEQTVQDVKGPETEASVFRNASISDKKIIDKKVRYGVAFGNQKHLPSRVMKNVIEVEKTEDGNEKFWFAEARVPLYLIKEYEESLRRVHVPFIKKQSERLSKLQRKQLKASQANIFSYLASRRDNTEKCSCASCHLDVLLRDATTCSSCQGFCHKDCTTMSTQHTAGNVETLVTCKRCYLARARSLITINHRHPTTPTVLINGQQQSAVTPVIKTQIKPLVKQLPSSNTGDKASGVKQVTPDSNMTPMSQHKTLSWGVIWRKKHSDDTGASFRRQNVVLAAQSDQPNPGPVCWLCKLPYNHGQTYIHCTSCDKWYHIEAINLEESKIHEVAGFKCCRCRRIRAPDCPYMDPKLKEERQKRNAFFQRQRHKKGNTRTDSDSEIMSEPRDSVPSTPSFPLEDAFVPKDLDVEWNVDGSAPGPQKLAVKRQVKREDTEGNNNLSYIDFSTHLESVPFVRPEMEPTLPVMECNASDSNNNNNNELMFDYQDMEFEPQTYFSLTELLTADDSGQCNGYGYDKYASGNTDNPNTQVETMGQWRAFLNDDTKPCQICMHVEPGADLTCQTCNITIHSHCSPWEEESTCTRGNWRCGPCREWM
ncbi:hypothetical protein IGI04_009660 [Brassica rapa subsp. trilocularis]|uniref:PHD-type domain-containing protein n=1 Tax=Brassica rapa subsp. trilocularis TaxID=1813537 RepID=A0ABQ7N0A4_BRACM|nr:hypothetical protein IGI04_009660 [Brassica rapa subsp. trilocularis]